MSSPEGKTEPSPEELLQKDELEDGDLIADVSEETRDIRAFAESVLKLKADEPIPDELIQDAFTALVRLYSVRFQLGERWSPFAAGKPVPATAAMIMCTAMLRSVNVEIFELGLWQSWSGA